MERLRKKLKAKYGGWKRLHAELCPDTPYSTFKDMFKPSFKSYRSSTMLLKACKKSGVTSSQLEKNILSYRTVRGRVEIEKVKLPIKISPIFDMLIAHIFGDGCCRKYGQRGLRMDYRQYNPVLLSNFIRKAEAVFGKLRYNREYFYAANRFYLPTACSIVLASYYGLGPGDFLSHNAAIPQAIFSKPKIHLVAFLTAFIIDEAAIDSSVIVITLCNKKLIDGLSKICAILGYEHSVRGKTLYILAGGVRHFWHDYLRLKQYYPEANMGYREEAICEFILRGRKKLRTLGEGERLNAIVALLSEKDRTAGELAKMLMISRQGARFHIKRLQREGVVDKIGEGRAGGHIYGLKKEKRYAVSKWGRSYQRGITKKRILALLAKKPQTPLVLSKLLKIGTPAIRDALARLETEGRIAVWKKVVLTTHPTYVWRATDRKA